VWCWCVEVLARLVCLVCSICQQSCALPSFRIPVLPFLRLRPVRQAWLVQLCAAYGFHTRVVWAVLDTPGWRTAARAELEVLPRPCGLSVLIYQPTSTSHAFPACVSAWGTTSAMVLGWFGHLSSLLFKRHGGGSSLWLSTFVTDVAVVESQP
jgi:hypothetical protein